MKKKLGCLHAHYSNIDYIENALSSYDIELLHFVDPGLMNRVTSDENFKSADAQKKVKDQIEWISQCHVDAILVTCTNYIAILQEDQLSISVPIIKIDEPYFEYISNINEPQIILFTNPATVKGTMERLNQYVYNNQKPVDLEVMVLDNAFDLLMQGQIVEYNQELYNFLNQIIRNENKVISVAQLSMVDASKQIENQTSRTIINPLNPLISAIVKQLSGS
ncbi:hypothetical protein HPT25_19515 [Bacillus sp. BRMEA1]|uniref:hypothetical protein n=1 Tax=Neobacillus endophyticus TaxID=2738405 RepID=UPI0015674F49|nr:hypothetical protein [Neobacillus endophyticus]NRD79553.1 hypothetical protein [Neobacillus endophyticus]